MSMSALYNDCQTAMANLKILNNEELHEIVNNDEKIEEILNGLEQVRPSNNANHIPSFYFYRF